MKIWFTNKFMTTIFRDNFVSKSYLDKIMAVPGHNLYI